MPGVPPDAVDNVKKLLKGIFRRGKSKKQDTQTQDASATPAQQPSNVSADKPLPPIQPQATEALNKPQGTTPVDDAAQPAPQSTKQDVNQPLASTDVSPTSPTPLQGRTSEPVSALGKDAVPEPGAADGAADASKLADTTNKENISPTTATETANLASLQPNGATTDIKPAEQPTLDSTVGGSAVKSIDDKVPVQDEIPAIPKAQLAPGMSATSGPLEDFPEGGGDEKN